MSSGDEPVGRPRTKGFSGVGAKVLMRSGRCEHVILSLDIKQGALTNDVVCNVLGGRSLVVSDDESPGVMSAL